MAASPPRPRSALGRLRQRVQDAGRAAADRLDDLAGQPAGGTPLATAQKTARALRDLALPAAGLARADVGAMRAWVRNVRAVEDALGAPSARAYSRVVVAAAEVDPELARMVAYTLPDHLARVPEEQRARYVKLLQAVLADRPAALPLVVRTLPELLARLDDAALARFLSRGLELHADSPRKAESWLRLESGQGRKEAESLVRGTTLAEVQRALTLYARAHCGETVQVRPAAAEEAAFTDGRHLYLPPVIDRYGDERDRLAYKVLAARAAGYLEFGTLDLDLSRVPGEWAEPRPGELEVERMLRSFANPVVARDLMRVLENLRVEARVRQEYPGVARDMDALADGWREQRPDPAGLAPAEQAIEWLARLALGLPAPRLPDEAARRAAAEAAEALALVRRPGATVLDTVAAIQVAFRPVYALLLRARDGERPPASEGQAPTSGRAHGEAQRGDSGQQDMPGAPGQERRRERRGEGSRDAEELDYQPMQPDPYGAEVHLERMDEGERRVEERASELLRAMQAEGADAEMEEARRQARAEDASYEEMAAMLERMRAPDGGLVEQLQAPADPDAIPRDDRPAARGVELDPDVQARPRSFVYPEWDAAIDDHKPNWVRLTEYDLKPGSAEFVRRVHDEQGALIGRIRRAFEALRPEGVRRLRGMPDGDDIDLDRWVEAVVEQRAGGSPSDRLYTRHQPRDRDVAVAFLVDMSSSTNEVANAEGKRVIDVEKEALVLIAEAVDAIGDDLAVWGFSGYGRDQVAFYVAKDFEDAWDDRARERIGRISWKMENRDGAAIRHATCKLVARRNRIKLLLILSDGKPLDCGCDHYSDRYAQDDTRAALLEARQAGIHPFCITVDPHGPEYLRRTYGETGYTVIDRVDALPTRLPLIYRRLTR